MVAPNDAGCYKWPAVDPSQGHLGRVQAALAGEGDILRRGVLRLRVGVAYEAYEQGQAGIGRPSCLFRMESLYWFDIIANYSRTAARSRELFKESWQ